MIKRIVDFFNDRVQVVENSDGPDSHKRIPLATCALLLEMAHTDDDFNAVERDKIINILKKQFDLSPDDADELITLADMERRESLDLWQFTNLINEHYSNQEKRKVLEILWRVIYADGKVSMYEDYLIRKVGNLLNLDHQDLIEAKFRAREPSPKEK